MKKKITKLAYLSAIIAWSSLSVLAQAPQSFSYQAVARDNAGNIIANQTISLRFTIHDITSGGTVVYQETQSATTNLLGLCNVSVGQGLVVSGIFSSISWGSGAKFLEVEIDPAGGSTYTVLGTTQMLSVPYALYSANGGGGTTGQDIIKAVGTGSVTVNSSITTWTILPGLSTTLTVPANAKLLVQTTGGVFNQSGVNNNVIADISIFVDNVQIGSPEYQRIVCTNPSDFTSSFSYWSMNSDLLLTAGSHTIDVRTLFYKSSFANTLSETVSDGPGTVDQGQLLVTIIKL